MMRRMRRPLSLEILFVRCVATEDKGLSHPAAPLPPMISQELIMPLDFSPHIEWYEFPKEVFNPRFPMTREDNIQAHDEFWDADPTELAEKYGVKFGTPPGKAMFAMGWLVIMMHTWWTLWGMYRGAGYEPMYQDYKRVVESHPNCPVVDEQDIYLDTWCNSRTRHALSKFDILWAWKPLLDEESNKHPNQWQIKFEHQDPSEWRHMLGR